MRITRTGLALSLVLALGCQKREKPPATEIEPAPVPVQQQAAPPINWLSSIPRFDLASKLEAEPSPQRPLWIDARRKAKSDPASAISAVFAANGGFVPETGEELIAALKAAGRFAHLPVSFSSVAMDSGLAKPRIVFAGQDSDAANRPSFNGRLFLAANLVDSLQDYAPPRLGTLEFISWNSRRLKFDFGVIDLDSQEPVKFLDGVRCFACHKTHGPILGVSPWSNTMHNPNVTEATEIRFGVKKKGLMISAGIPLSNANAPQVDKSVRLAEEFLIERRTVQALTKSPAGRTALLQVMHSLSQAGSVNSLELRTARLLSESDMRRFVYDAFQIQKAAVSSRLQDLPPDGMMGREAGRGGWWDGVKPPHLLDFDELRARGGHRLEENHVPSNPMAFAKRPAPVPYMATAIVTPSLVARAIGLTAGDRRFLADAISEAATAASQWTRRNVTAIELSERCFSSKRFSQLLEAGLIPDRDEFKDCFADGLADALYAYGYSGRHWMPRERYTSTPKIAVNANREETVALPSTACLGCHDIAKPGVKVAFNPIPPLPFDPFDAAGRQAWVKTNGGRGKEALTRMLKRLGKDMPPVDSAEHVMFREKNPEMFRAATEFLERELGRR